MSAAAKPPALNQLWEPQEFLAKARLLSSKLKSHNDAASDLLTRGCKLQEQLNAVSELNHTLKRHSSVPFLGVTRDSVVQDLHQERIVLRALRQENDELVETVQENGDAVQYIVHKYRQHSKRLCDLRNQDTACSYLLDQHYEVKLKVHQDNVTTMLYVAQQAMLKDDQAAEHRTDVLRNLQNQNVALRSVLKIALPSPSSPAHLPDKEALSSSVRL